MTGFPDKKTVLLGMSGGIDSSVSAVLLQQQGYEVTGITFRFWEENENVSAGIQASKICQSLGIPHIIYDAREIFREKVVSYFISEYISGKTPFPCARCNPEVKWKLMLQEADRLGIDRVAMGHYTGIQEIEGKFFVTQGVDPDKDQSFFLWGLTQAMLERIVFPLAKMHKQEVRKLADELGMKSLNEKKESTGPCFCTGDYRDFLKQNMPDSENYIFPGNFVNTAGTVLGQHAGYPLYTVGQRRGLGLQLNSAVYVKEIIPDKNNVVLSPHAELFKNSFIVENYNIHDDSLFSGQADVITRIRYRKQHTLSRIIRLSDKLLKVELTEPLDAIAPGQTAVFYRNGRVLGGGFVRSEK